MDVNESSPLASASVARHLGLEVRCADELIDIAKLEAIERLQPGAFSACTFEIGDRRVIVWSPFASVGRTQSDIAHEVSHLLLKHQVKQIERVGKLSFFACDPDEEQEANWLSGCLLLPRPLLLGCTRRGMTAEDIADTYEVSVQMADFRIRATGVLRQTRGN